MNQTLQFMGDALGAVDPRRWSGHSLREWLREIIVRRVAEGNEEGRLETVYAGSSLLLSASTLGRQALKKPSGTWDDKVIALFIRRMNVEFHMPPEMWQRIAPRPSYGDDTPMQFLARRRNAIAHGRRSFEGGASDLDLSQIRELADVTLDYMKYVVDAFETHVTNDAHLSAV